VEDAEEMRGKYLGNDDAFKLLGLLYGNDVISPRQIPVVKKEWLSPSHDDFSSRSVWSFYNACTEALKTAPPNKIMERHIALHNILEV